MQSDNSMTLWYNVVLATLPQSCMLQQGGHKIVALPATCSQPWQSCMIIIKWLFKYLISIPQVNVTVTCRVISTSLTTSCIRGV